jgi:hypothetical protein
MPRRKSPFPEKPWSPDPVKWNRFLDHKLFEMVREPTTPVEPKGGWLLFRLDTLEDVPQKK